MEGTSPTAAGVAVVESDAFCDCGYNLHGQRVWRDERLGILVCRCPECGRHAAAGRFTGIHSAWLHRLSMGLIVLWVIFLLGVFGYLMAMCSAWPYLQLKLYLDTHPVPNTVANSTLYVWTFRELEDVPQWERAWETIERMLLALANGLAIGGIVSVCLWHLRRRAYWFAVLPAVVCGVVLATWMIDPWPMEPGPYRWMIGWVVGFATIEVCGTLVGIWWGRAVGRFLVRLLLPDRLAQHLAFLWYRDGKATGWDQR